MFFKLVRLSSGNRCSHYREMLVIVIEVRLHTIAMLKYHCKVQVMVDQ